MYMLNLVFDLRRSDGLFGGDDPTSGSPGVLRKSMNWLELNGNPSTNPTAGFDPETASWNDLGQAGALLLSSNPPPGWICVRAVPDQRGPAPAATDTVELVLAFGRPIRFHQPHASPFTHDGRPNGRIVTSFVSRPITANTTRGWFFPIGEIARWSNHPNLTHRYEFCLGLIVNYGGQEYHYGEDPEMDIGR